MPDFELRFVASPEIKQDADKDLRKQWERRFQNLVVGRLSVDAEIPKQTITKLRNQYTQIMNDLGRTTASVGRDIEDLGERYGKAFDMTGISSKFKVDITKATEDHVAQVRQLESEYVNLKTKMRDAAQTLSGDAVESEINRLEDGIKKLGNEIRRTFSPDELEHFYRTMGELSGKGSGQILGIQEYADSISGLRTRIVELAGEGERLVRVTQEWDGKQWINTSTQILDKTQRLRDEFKKLNDQVFDFGKKYELDEGTSSYATDWGELNKRLKEFNVDAPDAREKLNGLRESFSTLRGTIAGSGDKLSLYKEKLRNIIEAEVELRKAQLENNFVVNDDIKKRQEVIDGLREKAEEYRKDLVLTDKRVQAENAEVDAERKLQAQLERTNAAFLKQHGFLSNVIAGFKDAAARVINYTSVYRVLWLGVSKFRESIQVAKELDKAFTEIQMVTLSTSDATTKLRKEYADLAHEMSGTVTQVASAANEWLRQGKTAEEATQLIKASMVMSRIGAIESAEATTYLTSVLNGYKIATEDVMHVVDAMSQVDIESASSIDDLAIALQRSSNVAATAGVSFERLLGYVATVREVTQRSASVVGESMKTVLSRFGSVKAGTFLSEDLESEYEDITSFANDVEKVLSKVGIRLRDTNHDFRDTQDVLDDIAAKWKTFTDLEKNSISTAAAGTRQRENFIALMENYDKALKLEESAFNSNGKAMQKYEVYQDSIAAKQERINALAQTWVQNMDFEWAIGKLLNLAEAFMKVFSNESTALMIKATAAIIAFGVGLRGVMNVVKGFEVYKKHGLVNLLIGHNAIAIIAGVVTAITALVWIIDKFHHSAAELRQELQGLNNEIETAQGKVDDYKGKIEENNKAIAELQGLISRGTGGLIEQDRINQLKEENANLERQIALEEKRLEILKGQQKASSEELYGKGVKVGQYYVGYGRNTATKDVHQRGSVTVSPEQAISAYEKQIDNLTKEYNKAVDAGNVKLADTIKKKILELEDELNNVVIPQLELLREYYPEIAAVLDSYYDSLSGYSEKFKELTADSDNAEGLRQLNQLISENAEEFQSYVNGNSDVLNEFSVVMMKETNPAIYDLIQAAKDLGIPLVELVRYLMNAAKAGKDFSHSVNLETPASQIEMFKDKVESVVSAEKELAETGYVSADAAKKLAEAYGEDVYKSMVWTEKGYKISKNALEDLINKQRESYVLALNKAQEAAQAVVNANISETASYKEKTVAILEEIKAKKKAYFFGSGARALPEWWGEVSDIEKDLENAQANLDNFEKTVEYLRGLGGKTSGSASKKESAYEREIRLLEHTLYLSQQIAEVYKNNKDEVNYRKEVNRQLEIYKNLMGAVHAEAERLRKLGYKNESEEIQKLQQAWWGYYNSRKDLQSGLADWEKQNAEDTASKVEDALSKVKDAINDLLDDAEDALNRKLKSLEAQIKKNEAIKALHEAFFGIMNDVADGMHEIDKELEASLSSADYLDEHLRQAMFNEEDYNKMSSKLKKISDESRVLFKDYLSQLEMLTEDEIYKADYITSEFERQYKYKELEYDIAQKELELAKAQTQLQNTLMNRNVRMYKNGEWVWTADYSAVQEAKKKVRDAEYEHRDAEIKLKQQEVIDKYEGIIDSLKMQKDAEQARFDDLKDMWERIQKQLTTEEDAMTRLLKAINGTDIPQFRTIINSVGSALSNLIQGITGISPSFVGGVGGVSQGYAGSQPHYSGGYGDSYVAPRTDGWVQGQPLPGTSGKSTVGTEYDNWVLANGQPPNLSFRDTTPYAAGTKPGIKGPDMSRDTKWAGQTVQKNGYAITYDDLGYAREAVNVRAGAHSEHLANVYPRVDADGNVMYSTTGGSSLTGREYYYSTNPHKDDSRKWDTKNPNYTGGGSSSSSSSNKGSSSSSSSSSSGDGKSNQQRYLENLASSGNYGQREWAKDQLNKKLYDSGGVLEGIGGIKATTEDETVFGPDLSAKILSPQKSREFLNSANALTKLLDNSAAINAMLTRFSNVVGTGGAISNDSHDIYLNGNPLGAMTKNDSVALTSVLRRYIPISGGGR